MANKKKCTDSKKGKESREYTQFTPKDRGQIEFGLAQGYSLSKIARIIGRFVSSVAREVMTYAIWIKAKFRNRDCAMGSCKGQHNPSLCKDCTNFVPKTCEKLGQAVVCNGCKDKNKCLLSKRIYDADIAQKEHDKKVKKRYEGSRVSNEELKRIYKILKPALKRGLSLYTIVMEYPEIGVSESTLRNYLRKDAFARIHKSLGDSWRKREQRKTPSQPRDRKNKECAYLEGHKMDDFDKFMEAHKGIPVTYMDVMYAGKYYLQTFFIKPLDLLVAFVHERETADAMVSGMNMLEELLGRNLFEKYVYVVVTDRGTEFSNVLGLEYSPDGFKRTNVFYNDPGCPGQKSPVENIHSLLRQIFDRKVDYDKIKVTQEKVNKAVSMVNSKPRKVAFDLSTFDFLEQTDNQELISKLESFGIKKVDRDHLVFSPDLLKD